MRRAAAFMPTYPEKVINKVFTTLDKVMFLWYIVIVKRKRQRNQRAHPRARVNKDGLMGSASREHRVRKGKGSFRRRKKHQKPLDR